MKRNLSGIIVFVVIVSSLAFFGDENSVKDNKSDLNCECDVPALPIIKFIDKIDSVFTFQADTDKKFLCKEPCKLDTINNAVTYKWSIQKSKGGKGNACITGNNTGTVVNVKLYKKGGISLRLTVKWLCTDQDNKTHPCSVTDVISVDNLK